MLVASCSSVISAVGGALSPQRSQIAQSVEAKMLIWASLAVLVAAVVALVTSAPSLGSGLVEILMLVFAGALFVTVCALEARQ